MFHKGHVPPHILDCDIPLLKPPPDNFIDSQANKADKVCLWVSCGCGAV